MDIRLNEEARDALRSNRPVVALESTVIAHGLPYPKNIETADLLERTVRENGAVPATVAMLDGEFCVGLSEAEIERIGTEKGIRKISRRDLAIAAGLKLTCATTVATTSFIAHRAGIRVFSTGGIGGVHRGYSADVSADLPELARTPITVVCSGAKIVLDLEATREWLETHGVTVLGWQCDELPAFYSRTSGLPIDERIDSPEDAAKVIRARDELGLPGALLLTVPVPEAFKVPRAELESILAEALSLADKAGVRGKEITPFLLSEMSNGSGGRTLRSNIALLANNARIASLVANELTD